MNHIYKSIFNKALGVFTAVPEFASAHGKGSERTVVGRVAKGAAGFAASALAISVGLALTSTSAVAGPGIYINDGKSDDGCIAIPDASGPNVGIYGISNTGGGVGVAILAPGQVAPNKDYFAMNAMAPCLSSGNVAQAFDTQTNRTLFYGNDSYGNGTITNNGAKNLTLGGRLDVNSGIIGVGDRGVNGLDATNSIRMGMGTALSDDNKKTDAITIGVNAGASAKHATAIGSATTAKTGYSTALGFQSQAGDPAVTNFNGEYATAIGGKAKALHAYTTALGAETNASGAYATAVGNEAKATHESTTAVGKGAKATNDFATAVGQLALASGKNGTAVGTRNEALGEEATALGYHSHANGSQQLSIGAHAGRNLDGSFSQSTHGISIGSLAGADNATAKSNDDSVLIGTESGRYAQGGDRNTSIGKSAGQYLKGSDNIAMGTQAGTGTATDKLEVNYTTAIGVSAKALTNNSIAIGRNSQSGKADVFGGDRSLAIGDTATAMGTTSIAIGANSSTSNGHDSIALGTNASTSNQKATAIGSFSAATGKQSLVIANNYGSKGVQPISVASGNRATAIGVETTVSGNNSVAIGDTNTVASARTYAMGNNINVAAGADDSLVFGTRAAVGGPEAIALGNTANSKTEGAISIGARTVSGDGDLVPGVTDIGNKSIAIGYESVANRYDTIAMGVQASTQAADSGVAPWDAVAIGSKAKATTYKALAIGAYSQATGRQSTVIGNDIQGQNSTASGTRSQILGVQSNVSGDNSVSIGDTNNIASARTYALGNNINVAAGADDSLAFGTRAAVEGENTIAMGNTAKAHTENSISIGKNSESGKVDKFDGKQSVAIGFEAKSMGTSTIAMGSYATSENGHDGVAIGTYAKTGNEKAITIGAYSSASGAQSIVIANNYNSDNSNNSDKSTATGRRAIVMGAESHATAEQALAIGDKNTVAAARTYAIGNNINVAAGADDALAFGTRAAVGGANTVAIGANANAAQANSVALGAGSATSAAHTGAYTLNNSYTAAGLPVAANGTVSVGSAGKERQIQNVAAGVISATSTDAINGSQLYATNNYMNNFAGDVKTKLGGNAALGNDGHLTMSNIGGTGKGNVHEAIAAVKGVADTAVQEVESENPTALSVKKDGTKVTLTPNFITGDLVNADGTVNAPATADEGKLVSAKTVADALKANHFVVDTKGNTETGSEADAKVGSGNKVTFEAGNNLVAKQANTANGGATVKFSLKDDISLNSVTAGTGANQVVLGNDGVKVGGNTYINNDGLNANSKVISNVADGVAPTDAVNKGQLDAVKGVADSAVKSVDTVASEENLVVDNNDPQNPKLRLKKAVNLTSIKLDGATPGNTTYVSGYGLTIEDGPSVKKEGINAGDKKITNVAAGDVSATSKDAVNGAQLHNVASSVANVLGGNAAVDGNGNVTSSDIGGTGANTVDDAIKAVNATAAKHTTVVEGKNVKVTKGKNAAGGDEYTVATKDDLDVTSVTAGNTTVNTNGLTITGGPSVTRGGIDAGNAVITNVRDGKVEANSKDAVNGGQLHATNTKLDGVKAKADTAVQDVKSGDENALTAVKDPSTNIVTVTPKLSGDLVDANGNITAPTTPAEKGKLVTAGTVAQALANTHFVVDTKATDGELDTASQADQKIKAGNKVTLQAGKNLKAKQTNAADGAQVEFSLKDSISLTQVTAGEGDNQVVLGNNGVQVGGNTYINKDGLNANSKVISNVADGVNPNDAVNKGQLDAVKGVADSAVKSVDVANGEQNLVVDNTDPKNPKLSLKKGLTVDSVKAGDSTLNTDGLTIAGGPSVKKDGINAGNKKITGVADGNVAAGSTDAVNGGQLYNVTNNVKDLIGPDATIDPATGKVTVADPAKGIGETGKGNIGDAIKHVNDAAKAAADTAKKHTTVEQGDNIVVEESLNADGGKHYKVSTAKDLNVDSVKAGDTTVNNDGVTIAGGPSVTKGGINAGGNTITNVADGVNPNDAVNKGQLDAVKGVADSAVKSVDVANGEQNLVVDNSDPKNPKLSLKKDLTVDSVKAGDSTLNNDGLTIAGGPSVKKDGIDAGDKKITNVATGDVAENSKDAVNGGQLYDVAKNVADLVGPDAKIDPATGKVTVTDPAKGIGETGKGNIGDAIKHVNDAAKAAADTAKKHTTVEQGDNIVVEESLNADGGKHYKVSTAKDLNVDSVKAGDTTVNNDGVTINNGPSMTKDGINANNTKVTNVADGVDAADAVNKGQLDKVDTKVSNVAQNVVNVLGGDATVNGNGDITMSNIGETGKGNINDAIKSVNDLAKKAAAEKTSVKAKEGRSNVTVTEGVNAAGGHEYTVDVERSVTNAGSNYVTVTNNHDADTNTTTYTVDVSAKTKASLAKADSAVQGLTSKDGNLNFTKGANGNVEVSFNDNLNVKNVTTDRVQVANGPSMSKDGINAAGKAISNVANGNVAADSKDAVNGGQLHETAKSVADVIGGGATVKDGKVVAGQNGIGNTGQNTVHGAIAAINQNTANNFNQIRGDLRKMDRDLRGGIAGALATAGLPQAFRPGKSMVAAAASTYRGQSGLAIGVSRISDNGKVILKVTGNTNSRGDFGGTIGAGYQW